jgi:DedD protein
MKLLSIFRRTNSDPARSEPARGVDDDVQRARTRARRRLVGAIVLVAIGVAILPMVYDAEPRPVPADIPIEIPRKDAAAPLAVPAPRVPAAAPTAPGDAAGADAPKAGTAREGAADASRSPAAEAAKAPVAGAPKEGVGKEGGKDSVKEPGKDTGKDTASRDAERARALLDGKASATAPAADAARVVVQVGAFADPASARDAVERVQKLGLKAYTQVVQTEAGPRTRVRIGPFATREEAQKAQARTEAAGIKSAVMTP